MDITNSTTMQPDNKPSTEVNPKNTDIVAFLGNDNEFVLAYKKTEKLSSAIYMITNLFADNEPMKWSLRKKAGDLMSFTITYKDIGDGSKLDFIDSAKTKVLEIVSMLEIANRGGLISAMNLSILKQEFTKLIDIFEASSFAKNQLVNNSISKIFSDNDPYANYSVAPKTTTPNNLPSFANLRAENIGEATSIKDKMVSTAPTSLVRDNANKTSRQTIILNLIKKRKELTIKDISEVIKDCSEKTIQRELNSFIANGVLKRAGVRRWSKYSMA